jgi:RNA polymerase sigma-70 factor (ECF subfamily)
LKTEDHIHEFIEKIEKNQGIIFKVSRTYCSNHECRRDLFQEIVLQLWRSYPSYNKSLKFTSWMYRVALNTAISQLRKDKKREVEYAGDIPLNIANEDLYNEKEERAEILHQAIAKLNKGEKSIIILYMDNYSYEEISEIIGISVSNVGVKINRIKSKLQKLLIELGYGL